MLYRLMITTNYRINFDNFNLKHQEIADHFNDLCGMMLTFVRSLTIQEGTFATLSIIKKNGCQTRRVALTIEDM